MARSDSKVKVPQTEFDNDRYLINLNNGIYHLKEMKFMPHDPKYLLSRIAPVNYEENATHQKWTLFLERIFEGNESLINFLSRVIGYSLTGDVGERCFFVFYGNGHNGKSTFINVIEALLGPYSAITPFSTFNRKANEGIPNDLAALHSVRFVSASEGESRRRLNESLIKQISGNDKIKARFLHQEWFQFTPEFKVFLNTNHKPIITGQDEAIWQRVKLIPFNESIPPEERIPNFHEQIINEELSGVLNWALKGLEDYWERGLDFPEEVVNATKGYREEQDLIGQFLNECCKQVEGIECRAKDLYDSYVKWCEQNGDKALGNRLFSDKLKEHGLEKTRKNDGNYWQNIDIDEELV
jgi:putative DNA primase/helicase